MPWFERLRLPVVSAPMFLVTGPALVLAACRAGIIGAVPTLNCRTADDLDRWFAEITKGLEETPKAAPWAANLMVHSTNQRLAADLELVVRYRAPLVITALGSPAQVVEAVHGYGGLVFADVATPVHARKAAAAGVDGLVLVCSGAGGHQGPLAMPAFVGEVRQFWNGPLMVAGTIANGAALRSAQVLGADLIYIGTPFIAAEESLASAEYKKMVSEASAADIVLSDSFTGAPANYLRPSIVQAGFDPANLGSKTQMNAKEAQNEARAWKHIWSAGQAVGQVRQIEPLARKVDRLEAEYRAAIAAERADPWFARYST